MTPAMMSDREHHSNRGVACPAVHRWAYFVGNLASAVARTSGYGPLQLGQPVPLAGSFSQNPEEKDTTEVAAASSCAAVTSWPL